MRNLLIVAAGLVFCLLAHAAWTQDRLDVLASDKRSQPEEPCTSFPAQPITPHEVPVIGVSFSGNLQMPVADQNLISSELKRLSYSEPLTGVYDELAERVKRSWQDRGFFHAQVNGDAIVTTRGADRGLAFSAQINEGTQYNLGGISFRGNKALTNVKFLRSVFPIEDGDVFNRSTVATGLENLRKGYGQYGHINYTGVPETRVDDEKHRIYVVVDIDEGKQFYVDRVEVLGLGDFSRQELVRESALQSGSVYNARLDEIFLMTIKSHFPDCECSDVKHNQIDERRGTVVLTYDLGSCAAGR